MAGRENDYIAELLIEDVIRIIDDESLSDEERQTMVSKFIIAQKPEVLASFFSILAKTKEKSNGRT